MTLDNGEAPEVVCKLIEIELVYGARAPDKPRVYLGSWTFGRPTRDRRSSGTAPLTEKNDDIITPSPPKK